MDDNQRTLGGSKFECRTYYIETCVGWHTGGPSPFDFCLSVVLNLLRMGYLIMVVGYGVKRPTIMGRRGVRVYVCVWGVVEGGGEEDEEFMQEDVKKWRSGSSRSSFCSPLAAG